MSKFISDTFLFRAVCFSFLLLQSILFPHLSQAVIGSLNIGVGNSGGSNTINNIVPSFATIGSLNLGLGNSGGSNIINNSSFSLFTIGSANIGRLNFGGSNTINNSGFSLAIIGSANIGPFNFGGLNTINNYGYAYTIIGSLNAGLGSSSTGNTINNWGTVFGDIWGNLNLVASAIGGNDTITNYGRVGGNIFGADGNDLIILVGGSSLGGVADGGDDIDMIGFSNMGTQHGSLLGTKYLNFENLGIFGGYNNLIGTWDFSQGFVAVYNGDLYINGTLFTNLVTVYANGLLGGAGTIYSDIINYGTISPGNSIGTLTVNGNVTFMPGSVYLVEITAGGASDLLDISGTLNLYGGTVQTTIPRALYTNGRTWTIIIADGGINGRFSSLSTGLNSVTLKPTLSYGSNTVRLVIYRVPFAELGATANQQAIGSVLDGIVPRAKGGMISQIISMDFDMNLAQIQETLNAMSPEMYSAFSTAGLKSAIVPDQATVLHQTELRLDKKLGITSTKSAQDELQQRGWNLWVRFLGNRSERDSEDDSMGFTQEMSAIITGFDRTFNDWLLAGITLAYSDSDLEWDEAEHSGSVAGKHIGIYTSSDVNGFFIDSGLSYSDFDNSAGRDISFSGFSTTAGNSFDSRAFLGRVKGGYDFNLNGWLISPVASLRYAHLDRDGFTEEGGSHLKLEIEDSDSQSFTASFGVQLAGLIEKNQWKLIPRAALDWVHEFEDDAIPITASFVDYSSSSFTVNGIAPVSDYGLLDISFSARYGRSLSFFFDYKLAMADGYDSHLVTCGLAYRF